MTFLGEWYQGNYQKFKKSIQAMFLKNHPTLLASNASINIRFFHLHNCIRITNIMIEIKFSSPVPCPFGRISLLTPQRFGSKMPHQGFGPKQPHQGFGPKIPHPGFGSKIPHPGFGPKMAHLKKGFCQRSKIHHRHDNRSDLYYFHKLSVVFSSYLRMQNQWNYILQICNIRYRWISISWLPAIATQPIWLFSKHLLEHTK